ncbi:hypothetical protein QTG54_000009 [Skeletonema marinoi]|uniref:Uncharacterized protein n=1 Tax=Skeletonema marinoi TaxID=267567 RepID=A0AAD8YMN5_9STRA|nr:hypothetical protein QTG54_000009 [Skeletonema marinoi]
MIDSDNKSSSSSAHKIACTSGPRRGKVLVVPASAAVKKEQHVVTDEPPPPPPPSTNSCHVDSETSSAPTVEDYANLFFGSDDDTSLTGNSIQSLAMTHHHQWEPEPHLPPTRPTTSSSIVPLLPPTTHCHRRKRRRVSFTTTTPTIHTLHTVPTSSTMTPLEKSTSWLQHSDIETLKSSAQSTIQTVRNRVSSNAREYKHRHKFRALMVTIEQETDSSIRGLEHKVYRRKETRRMLIQDVIECQHHIKGLARFGHVMSSDEKRRLLANASLQKSLGCVKKALLDANDDYKEVYGQKKLFNGFMERPPVFKIRRVSSGAVTDDGAAKKSP